MKKTTLSKILRKFGHDKETKALIKQINSQIKKEQYTAAINNIKDLYYIMSIDSDIRKKQSNKSNKSSIDYKLINVTQLHKEQINLDIRRGKYFGFGYNFLANILYSVEIGLITGFIVTMCTSDSISPLIIKNIPVNSETVIMAIIVVLFFIGIYNIHVGGKNDKFTYFYEKALCEIDTKCSKI